jgi:hypothetical protein
MIALRPWILAIFLSPFVILSCTQGDSSKPTAAEKLYLFENYKEVRILLQLDMVLDRSSFTDITLSNERFPIRAFLLDADGNSVDVDCFRADGAAGEVPYIGLTETGTAIETIVHIPMDRIEQNLPVLFEVDASAAEGTGLALQSSSEISVLKGLSIAKPNAGAEENPKVLLSVASTIATKIALNDSKSFIATENAGQKLTELIDTIADLQKTLQVKIKRNEEMPAKDYIEALFRETVKTIANDSTISQKVENFSKSVSSPEKPVAKVEAIISVLVSTEENPVKGKVFQDDYVASPTVTSAASLTTNPRPKWEWTGQAPFRYKLNEAEYSEETSDTSFTPTSNLPDGDYTLSVQSKSESGKWSESGSFKVSIDTTAPAAPAPSLSVNLRTLTVTFSAVSGASQYRYKIDGTDLSTGATPTTSFSFQIDNIADGSHTFSIAAGDSLNQWSSTTTVNFTIDATAPAAPTITVSSPTNAPAFSWTNGNGYLTSFRYKFNDSDLSSGATVTSATTLTPNSLSDGTHTLYLQGRGANNLWSNSASAAVVVDTVGPSNLSLTGEPTGTVEADALSVTVSGTDAAAYAYKLVSGGGDCSSNTGYSSYVSMSTAITESPASVGAGTVLLCVRVKDASNNVSETSTSWTQTVTLAPSGPVAVTVPSGSSYIYPLADDTLAGAAVVNRKLYYLLNNGSHSILSRLNAGGATDTTFGNSGFINLSTASGITNNASGAVPSTIVACNNRLFGLAGGKMIEYKVTGSGTKTLDLIYDASSSHAAWGRGDTAPPYCLEDRYFVAVVADNTSPSYDAFFIYDVVASSLVGEKVFTPRPTGQYVFPLRRPSTGVWYALQGSGIRPLDGSWNLTGSSSNISWNTLYVQSVGFSGNNVNMMFKDSAWNVRALNITSEEFITRLLGSTWGAMSGSNYMDYTVLNREPSTSGLYTVYGCTAGSKTFFMGYSANWGASPWTMTFAFGLYGSSGTLDAAFNSGSEMVKTTDPYNSYTARYYTSISCDGSNVVMIQPTGTTYSSSGVTIHWINTSP